MGIVAWNRVRRWLGFYGECSLSRRIALADESTTRRDNHITACASDGVSFEVRPNKSHEWDLHNFLLAGWGVPIGEMFYLEELAELCKKHNRWTFFVTSSPLNVPRGCSSPPN